ncbi:MAG: hypothetical protein KIS73_09490 [Enhydrobacter sp.]|nr:hypothetical protein [Enhydrobacter sp.]
MPAKKSVKKEARAKLNELDEKLDGAKKAAAADGAGALAKADLKLLEQEVVAEKLKAKRPTSPSDSPTSVDGKLDKALKDSFPGSDPVSFVEAAPIKDQDRSLPTVPDKEPNEKT